MAREDRIRVHLAALDACMPGAAKRADCLRGTVLVRSEMVVAYRGAKTRKEKAKLDEAWDHVVSLANLYYHDEVWEGAETA